MRKLARLVTGASETCKHAPRGAIENVNLVSPLIDCEQETLIGIRGEAYPGDRAPRDGPGIWIVRSRVDHDVSFEIAHFVEHLDAVALFIANVNKTGVVHNDAMNDSQEAPPVPASASAVVPWCPH